MLYLYSFVLIAHFLGQVHIRHVELYGDVSATHFIGPV